MGSGASRGRRRYKDEVTALDYAGGERASPRSPGSGKAIFYDMLHSNNAARVRLFIELKGLKDQIESRILRYEDLQTPDFTRVNPLKKVPAFVTDSGRCLFESFVILEYLEDRYGSLGDPLKPSSAEDRAFVNLLIRVHDLYISSPNCTQPGFSHTQGCCFLAPNGEVNKWCQADRTLDRMSRAAKLAEIWKQLNWLEETMQGPFLAGPEVTLADVTWYPTCLLLEYFLPTVFGWLEIFHEQDYFPKLTFWFERLTKYGPEFGNLRKDIWTFWEGMDAIGQYDLIKEETKDHNFKWIFP